MNEKTLPISKLSYTSLTQLLRNPIIFKLKEILGVYDVKSTVSSTIGKAVHEALKFYYGGNKELACPADLNEARPMAKELGLKYLTEVPDGMIRYGKTGSRETMYKGYTQAMDFYFSEEPVYHNILIVEEKLEGELKTIAGDILPLPAVGKPDLVIENKNSDVDIIDVKTVKSFTDYENEDGEPHEDYIKIIQAKFMSRLLKSTHDISAKRMVFRELKRTANKDGSRQIRDYVVPLDHEPYDIIFDNLYKDVYKFISNPDAVYLPNLSDPFDGEHAGLIYAQGLISSDMSDVEVVHKVREVAFTSKKFVSSRLDSEINRNLLPEEKIKVKLAEFGIPVEPVGTEIGSAIIQYRFKVSAGVRMTTIKKHHDDIVKALEAKGDVRILAPIPGTSLIGVEVERAERQSAKLADAHMRKGTLNIPVGVDIQGNVCSLPLNEMPHLLIAGATGSGKSVLLHTIITTLSKQLPPEDMQLLLIDPKRVELSRFKRLPHLREKILYEHKGALRAFSELTEEMERRYLILEKSEKRDIQEFNTSKRDPKNKLPYIVCVVDEFADFMMTSRMEERKKVYEKNEKTYHEIEYYIVRLAQMARAVGIHLIIATQRPSVDVITGLIKANFPSRIALTTSSAVDSGVILGSPGAEKLSGKGDLLLQTPLVRGTQRLQALITK